MRRVEQGEERRPLFFKTQYPLRLPILDFLQRVSCLGGTCR